MWHPNRDRTRLIKVNRWIISSSSRVIPDEWRQFPRKSNLKLTSLPIITWLSTTHFLCYTMTVINNLINQQLLLLQHPRSLMSNAPQSVAIRNRISWRERARKTLPFAIIFSDLRANEITLFMFSTGLENRQPRHQLHVRCASNVTRKRAWRPSQSSRSPSSLYALARVRRFKNTNKSALHRGHMTHRWPVTDWFSAVSHSPSIAAWRTNLHRDECSKNSLTRSVRRDLWRHSNWYIDRSRQPF